MSRCFFVTGTDTGVGKTAISCALLSMMNKMQVRTLGIKPVASGLIRWGTRYYNEDALRLKQFSSIKLPYKYINPYAFHAPVSPHWAATLENKTLSAQAIVAACQPALTTPFDFALIEGVGGWFAPINAQETMAEVARLCQCPVILVVGMRLGCLNHALLTYQAIKQSGLTVAGWVANQIVPDMLYCEENIDFLKHKIAAPCLGVVPYER